jgi:hypothetical protein
LQHWREATKGNVGGKRDGHLFQVLGRGAQDRAVANQCALVFVRILFEQGQGLEQVLREHLWIDDQHEWRVGNDGNQLDAGCRIEA